MSLPPDGMNWASDREWEGAHEYADYTVCRPCREGVHDVCWGPNYKPRFPIDTGTHNIWIQGCRCNEEWTHPWHSPVKLIRDVPWVCAYCKSGHCEMCHGKECECPEHERKFFLSGKQKPQIEERLHMETVPALSGMIKFSREQIELIKSTVAVGATDAELELFKQVCEARGLNPFLKQIYCIRRKRQENGKWIEYMVHQTGIDGFRLIAQRTGRYGGQLGPFFTEDGINWTEAWIKDTAPKAAKVGVIRKDFKEPVWAMARFNAYCPRNERNEPTGQWKNMPDGQIAKCAEALALRRAFPEELSGLHTNDEMRQAGEPTHYDAEIKVINDVAYRQSERDVAQQIQEDEADGKLCGVEQEDLGEHFGQEPQGKHRPISEMFAAPDSTVPDALADAAEKAMIDEMWKRCKAPFAKKLAALQAVGFTTIEELRKSQLEACAEALHGL